MVLERPKQRRKRSLEWCRKDHPEESYCPIGAVFVDIVCGTFQEFYGVVLTLAGLEALLAEKPSGFGYVFYRLNASNEGMRYSHLDLEQAQAQLEQSESPLPS